MKLKGAKNIGFWQIIVMEKVDSKALRSMEVVSRSHETSSLEHSTGQLSSHPAIVCQLKMQTSEESEWLPSVLCSPGK